jgi:hypothetical protein
MAETTVHQNMTGVICAGLLMGAGLMGPTGLMELEMAWAQDTTAQPARIDRTLPGSRKGIATKAEGGIVWIDGARYAFAPGALVEKKRGSAMSPANLKWEGVEIDVEYWVDSGLPDRRITQMVIHFRE